MFKKLLSLLLCLCLLPTVVSAGTGIVSCYYISTATLLALGCGSQLTGIEKKAKTRPLYTLCAPEVLNLPAVGSGKEVNLEQILLLDPALTVLPRKLASEADRLSELGVPTVIVHPESEPEFLEMVTQLGMATGTEEAASRLLDLYLSLEHQLEALLTGTDTPVLYLAAESSVLTTYPAGLYQNDQILRGGGKNAAAELPGSAKVTLDPEELLVLDPDVILLVSGADYTPADVVTDPRFSGLRAVKNGRVYAMPDGIESWDYPTPTSVLGAWYIAYLLHPDRISFDTLAGTAVSFYRDVYGFTPSLSDFGLEEP